jgi:hypothetical protein
MKDSLIIFVCLHVFVCLVFKEQNHFIKEATKTIIPLFFYSINHQLFPIAIDLFTLFESDFYIITPSVLLYNRSFFQPSKKGLKKTETKISVFAWQRPTLTGTRVPTTIGAEKLNFRVRYGNGCDLLAIAARLFD